MGLSDMATVKLRYVVKDTDRHGNDRYYLRRPGQPKIRLPGLPGTTKFAAAHAAALAGPPPDQATSRQTVLPGSFRALCVAYFKSPSFRKLDHSTQSWRRRSLEAVCVKHGHKPVDRIEPRHVRKLRDEKAIETPAAANTLLKALRAMFSWAVEEERVASNPTRDVKAVKYATTGHHTWSWEEVEAFKARHPVGSKARLAMTLLLGSAGRREDAVRLGRQHIRDGRLRFTQAKNEHRNPVFIDVPVHPDLQEALVAASKDHLTFLTTEYGKPFTVAGFGNKFREWCDEAGLQHCSAHGLRKAALTFLAEAGCTAHEIMAVSGHRTLAEVERYTKAARQAVLADTAFAKVQRLRDAGQKDKPETKMSH
jgi:integrase